MIRKRGSPRLPSFRAPGCGARPRTVQGAPRAGGFGEALGSGQSRAPLCPSGPWGQRGSGPLLRGTARGVGVGLAQGKFAGGAVTAEPPAGAERAELPCPGSDCWRVGSSTDPPPRGGQGGSAVTLPSPRALVLLYCGTRPGKRERHKAV